MTSNRPSAHLVGALALIAAASASAGCQLAADPGTQKAPSLDGGSGGQGAGDVGRFSSSSSSSSAGDGGSVSGGGDGGSTAGAGGEGGSGPRMTGADTCGGEPLALDYGYRSVLMGDTSLGQDDYASGCEASSGPDMVYQLDVASPGTMSFFVSALAGQDVSVYLRRSCDNENTVLWCRNHDQAMLTRSFIVPLDTGTYYLFVDTDGATGGQYELSVSFDEGACGDTAVNAAEQCDDGNTNDGDGCDASCQLEPGSNDTCADPQGPVTLPAGHTLLTGTTTGNAASHAFDEIACGTTDYGGGRDRVIAVTPQIDGELSLSLGYDSSGQAPSICEDDIGSFGCWDRVLHVRHAAGDASAAACQDVENQIACAAGGDFPSYVQDITIDVVANETYFIFVDSFWDGDTNPSWASGPYYLHLDLAAPTVEEPPGGGSGG